MITKDAVLDAYLFLRKNNHSIPSEVLEFMKTVSIREIEKIETARDCNNCKHNGMQMIYPSPCTGCGGNCEYKNFELKD